MTARATEGIESERKALGDEDIGDVHKTIKLCVHRRFSCPLSAFDHQRVAPLPRRRALPGGEARARRVGARYGRRAWRV
jgi:hypothetical protein